MNASTRIFLGTSEKYLRYFLTLKLNINQSKRKFLTQVTLSSLKSLSTIPLVTKFFSCWILILRQLLFTSAPSFTQSIWSSASTKSKIKVWPLNRKRLTSKKCWTFTTTRTSFLLKDFKSSLTSHGWWWSWSTTLITQSFKGFMRRATWRTIKLRTTKLLKLWSTIVLRKTSWYPLWWNSTTHKLSRKTDSSLW
jgi:hypothetical protein